MIVFKIVLTFWFLFVLTACLISLKDVELGMRLLIGALFTLLLVLIGTMIVGMWIIR